MIPLICVYLLGIPVSYIFFKKATINEDLKWSIADRNTGIFISLFSWVGVAASFLSIITHYKNDKPAKW